MPKENIVDTQEQISDPSTEDSLETSAATEPTGETNAEANTLEETPPPTSDEITAAASEKAFQRMSSWQGRRDVDLANKITGIIDDRFANLSQQQQAEPAADFDILTNPDQWTENKIKQAVPQILKQEIQKQTQQDQRYTSELIQQAGSIMDNDELFKDKEFGNQVVAEIQTQFSSLNKNLSPGDGAQLLVSRSINNVIRKQKAAKINPLADNNGGQGNKPPGSLTPPNIKKQTFKPVQLSALAQKMAESSGFSQEEVAGIFKD